MLLFYSAWPAIFKNIPPKSTETIARWDIRDFLPDCFWEAAIEILGKGRRAGVSVNYQ